MRSRSKEGWQTRYQRLGEWHKKYAFTPTRVHCGPNNDTWCWVWFEYFWRKRGDSPMLLTDYNRRTEEWHSHCERP